ncbi:M28 family peptidase [Flavobacterium dankookense]|uniref:Putative secreted protein (Por secretion system target) n=1 Tax=Flavobacterium dankookense TaxID=706186 RepID=A0A4R6QB32_9FLAO|nr:M28 family peptidase [Flavobacterium dankookense]TDP59410.1 putative secreted protein (Por secretion system target) [Flavobacterium dankookense]
MKNLLLTLTFLFTTLATTAQVYTEQYATIVNQVSATNILNNLTEFENLGVKRRGTTPLQNTLNWLKAEYLSYGYIAAQMQEYSFTNGNTTGKNLVVTKLGTLYPDTFVIICGHYDTINGKGTNDNGSGVVTIFEVARLLQNIPTEYSIKFINFSGEEDGLIGSQHFVSTVVNATTPKMDIKLVFNIDEVGGRAGFVNDTITCERDTGSPTSNNAASNLITNQLMNCVELYSPLNTFLSYAYASDYMPFEENNEIITGFFETNETPHRHTATDLLVNMDPEYVYNIAKAATGAMLHFAVASTSSLDNQNFIKDHQISFYPNPAKEFLNINFGNLTSDKTTFTLVDINGKKVIENQFDTQNQLQRISVASIPNGIYLAVIETNDKRITKKIVID